MSPLERFVKEARRIRPLQRTMESLAIPKFEDFEKVGDEPDSL